MDDRETSLLTHGDGTLPGGPAHGQTGPLLPGAPFGSRYRVLKVLGAGGMGVVYQAWDEELGVPVALKVIRPEALEDPFAAREIERRFKQELLLARQVTHRNVVRIHDLGDVNGIKYLTMPFIEGQNLAASIRDSGSVPPARALAIARQIVSGLAAAHQVGIVHRDLKPENVMITAEGEAIIMDFGIARSLTATGTRTALGAVIGTLEYMAPEQSQGQPVDHRADIYSFGLILYDMLVGRRRLASTENAISELMIRLKGPPPSMRTLDSSIPEALDRIVTKCLEPDPERRYGSTAELLEALERLDPDGRERPAADATRGRLAAIGVTAGTLAIMALAAWLWGRSGGAPAAPVQERPPVSVLVTDFRNQAGDQVFEGTIEQALTLALEGAPFITTYPRSSAMRLLQRLKPGSALNEETGPLVALSEGIKVVLAGEIASTGSGYEIRVRGFDPASASGPPQAILSVSRRAENKDAVLGTVSQLAGDIRRTLGDTEVSDAPSETVTAANLEAARAYVLAQRLAEEDKDEQAIAEYQRAISLDPGLGRAYSGWATSLLKLGRRAEAKDRYDEALRHTERMTEREKLRTLGAYHIAINNDYEKGIENYAALVAKYPADGAGHNNLAVAYFSVLDFSKALEEGRRLLDIYPDSVLYRYNYALYAMYAGQFDLGAEQARRALTLNPETPKAYLVLAMTALAAGKADEARTQYERARGAGPRGPSLATVGLADLSLSEGRFEQAIAILEDGIAADAASKNVFGTATKRIALAQAQMALGNQAAALASIDAAMAVSTSAAVLVPAADLLVEMGRSARAASIASSLQDRLSAHDRTYAAMIRGRIASHAGRSTDALLAFAEARKLADLWLVRYHQGIAAVRAGGTHFASALADLELCLKRRGEATAVFLDDIPTYRYLVDLHYWLARAQEGLGSVNAARESYEAFLAFRAATADDPQTADARRRLSGLTAAPR